MSKASSKGFCLCVLATLAGTVAPAYAEKPSYSTIGQVQAYLEGLRPSYAQCINNSSDSISSISNCTNTELTYQNKRLNEAYKKLMAALNPAYQKQLRDDERTWIKYRDSVCAKKIYGVDQPQPAALGCTLEETGRRASLIESWLSQRQ